MSKIDILQKHTILWISALLFVAAGGSFWAWNRFGPSHSKSYEEVIKNQELFAVTLDSASNSCDLEVRRYKQIGKELQFELAANASGLAPYDVEVTQNGKIQSFKSVPHRYGIWLTLPLIQLASGPADIKVTSLGQSGCETKAQFSYDEKKVNDILAENKWIRQGSKDNWLDIRPVSKNGKIYLTDFADYEDGRTKVVLIDGIEVKDLKNGIEVKPGYLYSVTAKWIDAPYSDWWNKLRNRAVRQQNIWIAPVAATKTESTGLTKIEIPSWFRPSSSTNVIFDTLFPEFEPIKGKIVAQHHLNDYVPDENYFKRGINYIRNPVTNVPPQRQHWTSTANHFADQKEDWFGSISKKETEERAAIPDFGIYALDYEYWNQNYTDSVKQRLIWFTNKIKKDHPNTLLFDYWGGGAYINKHISTMGAQKPLDFIKDYSDPKPNTPNFEPLANGQNLQKAYDITPIDVYAKPMFPMDDAGNTAYNFTLLSAIHAQRINKLIPFQKGNKFIFYGWNRYQPLYGDPIVPWNLRTTQPKGELVLNQMEMIPASQAMALSMFSLVLFDGYYLWSDWGVFGNDPNGYYIPKKGEGWGMEWYPDDSKSPVSALRKDSRTKSQSAPFWDFPTEYYVLGNWMSKQVEDILVGGTNVDLPFKSQGNWVIPKKEQVLLAMNEKQPFVTSIVKGNKIAVLAVDSFQPPTAEKQVAIRLPDGTETTITLYGNWPALYRGTLKK